MKLLAAQMPDELWLDNNLEKGEELLRVRCFDLRLMEFSLNGFGQPEVMDEISRLATETREAALKVALLPNDGQRLKADVQFHYRTINKCQFGVAWYASPDWIRWPGDDSLRLVIGAKENTKQVDGVRKAADPFTDLVLAAIPSVPLADLTAPDTQPKRGRPMAQRRLVRDSFDQVINASDAVLSIVGDIATAVVQKTLDGMCGHAFALLADNKHFTEKLNDSCQQYGIRLYYQNGDQLVHVGIRAVAPPGTQKTNPTSPAALAGAFNLSAYRSDLGGSSGFTNLALFPALIAARSLEQAQQIIDERKKQSSDQ